jgi:hypothetical protein
LARRQGIGSGAPVRLGGLVSLVRCIAGSPPFFSPGARRPAAVAIGGLRWRRRPVKAGGLIRVVGLRLGQDDAPVERHRRRAGRGLHFFVLSSHSRSLYVSSDPSPLVVRISPIKLSVFV